MLRWEHLVMDVQSLPGVSADRLVELLRSAEYTLGNVRNVGHTGFDIYEGYLAWSKNQVRMLRYAVTSATLDALVTTPRYRMLVALDPSTVGNNLRDLIGLEIDAQVETLKRAQDVVRGDQALHAGVDVLVVPDTNIYLHARRPFDEINWASMALAEQSHVRLIVPLLVIDELDRAKRITNKAVASGKESVGDRARRTLRTLETLFSDPASPAVLPDGTETSPKVSIALLMDASDHVRSPDADYEIIGRVSALADRSGKPTSIVTSDTGMRLRARASNLTVSDLPED